MDAERKMSLVRLREIALEREVVANVDANVDVDVDDVLLHDDAEADTILYGDTLNNDHDNNSNNNNNNNNNNKLAQQVLENVSIHSLLTTRELMDALDLAEKEIIHRNAEAEKFRKLKQNNSHDCNDNIDSGGTIGNNHNDNNNNGNNDEEEEASSSYSYPSSTQRLPVRLIVIDSIAAPIRRDFDLAPSSSSSSSSTAYHRAAAIFEIARKLKQLAHDFQLAVVVVNQVVSGGGGGGRRYSNSNSNSNSYHHNNNQGNGTTNTNINLKRNVNTNTNLNINADGEFNAYLGTAWQYCVSTRIVLEHENDPHALQTTASATTNNGSASGKHGGGDFGRTATIAKSLVCKRATFSFRLSMRGLCEVSASR